MDIITRQIHSKLLKSRKTVAVAESCTGGLLSKLLTEMPGSSDYFILGVVAYSNKAKECLLKVPSRILAEKGAVSSQTARLMAQNVRKIAGTDFGVAITGIAGPTGGTARKHPALKEAPVCASAQPVGTVFIAVSSKKKTILKRCNLTGSRSQIRRKAAEISLKELSSLMRRDF